MTFRHISETEILYMQERVHRDMRQARTPLVPRILRVRLGNALIAFGNRMLGTTTPVVPLRPKFRAA